MTCLPGDVLSRGWKTPVGRLSAGAVGDLVVIAQRRPDPWASLVAARERDVQLVVVGGRPLWGTTALMHAAGAVNTTAVRMGSTSRKVVLVRPDDVTTTWTWTDVLARLDAVRANAKTHPPSGPGAQAGRANAVAFSADPPGTPPIAIVPDMPGGPQVTAGPPPHGQTVDIPAIEKIYHDPAWLKTIKGKGFHDGALDGLAAKFG
jgi:5-methylthioadenosine/S-adenosylhomocysteine deaminase